MPRESPSRLKAMPLVKTRSRSGLTRTSASKTTLQDAEGTPGRVDHRCDGRHPTPLVRIGERIGETIGETLVRYRAAPQRLSSSAGKSTECQSWRTGPHREECCERELPRLVVDQACRSSFPNRTLGSWRAQTARDKERRRRPHRNWSRRVPGQRRLGNEITQCLGQ